MSPGLLDRSVAGLVPVLPRALVDRVARRYIAGATLDDALAVATRLRDQEGCEGTLDVLGEHVRTREDACDMVAAFELALRGIKARGLPCGVSVKLSSLGLGIDHRLCVDNLDRVLSAARETGCFCRIDMEDATTVDRTLDLVEAAKAAGHRVGAVLQARLFRTPRDLERLIGAGIPVRLVKGIYLEPASISHTGFREIQKAFLLLVERAIRAGIDLAIATHDDRLLAEARRLLAERGPSAAHTEFQVLLGVREDLRRGLRAEGRTVRVYVPYGRDWRAYSLRRLRENPRMATQITRALVGLR
ncbi:MAG: proline dehydrogenase family protein [Candidatus Dormibacteraeota bacterium]|nr:proline dehydrogenase family protein [Candidatus Dormibacteraeota bacterium]